MTINEEEETTRHPLVNRFLIMIMSRLPNMIMMITLIMVVVVVLSTVALIRILKTVVLNDARDKQYNSNGHEKNNALRTKTIEAFSCSTMLTSAI